MQIKNLALLSMAALAVAAPAPQDESAQDIHHVKDKIHQKKCPKPECPKSTTIITTQYHTVHGQVTVTSQKACAPAPTQKNHCPKCGDPNCGGC